MICRSKNCVALTENSQLKGAVKLHFCPHAASEALRFSNRTVALALQKEALTSFRAHPIDCIHLEVRSVLLGLALFPDELLCDKYLINLI
jgi:hypothetical protein